MRFYRVGHGEDRQHATCVGQECHRAPLSLVFDETRFDRRAAQFALLNQAMIPKDQVLATDAPLNTAPWQACPSWASAIWVKVPLPTPNRLSLPNTLL